MPLTDNDSVFDMEGTLGYTEGVAASANYHGFIKKEPLEIFCATCNYNCYYLSTASKGHLMAEMTAMDLSVPLENPDCTFPCYMMYLHYSLRQKDPGHIFLT